MTHKETSLILVDGLAGRLEPATLARMEPHLGSCEECRGAIETMRLLRGEPGTGDFLESPVHLPIERVVELSLAGAPADEAHLASCPACAAEVAACRASIAEARAESAAGDRSGGGRFRPFMPAALAAGLTLVALGYPAYLGLVALPRARRAAESAPAPDRGEAVLALYLGSTRGAAGPTPSIEPAPGARFVTLLLEPIDPRADSAAEPIRYEIRDGEGRVVWSLERAAESRRERREPADRLLTLLVPASALPPGTYSLSLAHPGQDEGQKLFEAPFAIVAPAAAEAP